MSDAVLVILGALAGGLFGFLGQALSAHANRNKVRADAINTNADTLGKMGVRIDELVERNIRVERERDKERDAKREELISIHNQLTTLQDVHSSFISQFNAMQKLDKEKDAKIAEQDNKIKDQAALIVALGQRVRELEALVEKHTKTLKNTGQLTPRNG